jgi:AcrR family transcriptional regulator
MGHETDSTTSPRTQPNRDAKREAILDVAARLFQERGYDATSVRDIAKAAGISQATLYYYIGSKPDALIAIHDAAMAPKLDDMLAIAQSDATPVEKLRGFIHAELRSIDRDNVRWAIIERERMALPAPDRARIIAKRDQVDAMLTQILEEGVAANVFRPGPVKSWRMAILGITNKAAAWYKPGGPTHAEQFAEDFCDLVLYGLLDDTSRKVPLEPTDPLHVVTAATIPYSAFR